MDKHIFLHEHSMVIKFRKFNLYILFYNLHSIYKLCQLSQSCFVLFKAVFPPYLKILSRVKLELHIAFIYYLFFTISSLYLFIFETHFST